MTDGYDRIGRIAMRAFWVAGLLASAAGMILVYWHLTARTPLRLYARFGAAQRGLVVGYAPGGIPVEYALFVWYVLAGAVLIKRAQATSALRLVFMSAVLVVGICAPIVWHYSSGVAWPAAVGTACALLILVATGLSVPGGAWSFGTIREAARKLRGNYRTQASVASAAVLAVGGATALRAAAMAMGPDEAAAKMFSRWYMSRSVTSASSAAGLVAPGEVRVVVFTDFQCPFCAAEVPEAEVLIDDMSRTARGLRVPITFISRDYPLDHACNPGLDVQMHPLACQAAVAARVVGLEAGKAAAVEFKSWLYLQGSELTERRILQELSRRGLLAAYQSGYDAVVQQVEADATVAMRVGVNGTPTFFVDGIEVPASRLQTAIAIELHRARERARAD
jgi:protein-disulfide isomerase